MKKITPYKVFSLFNILIMLVLVFVTAYPVWYVIVASFSDSTALTLHNDFIWLPLKPYSLAAYRHVFRNPLILSGYANTIFVLVVGLAINLVMTILGAYFLSIKGPKLKNAFTFMIIFTMYFHGGMIPTYLNIKELHLLDSLWALILPGAIGTSNMIIMRTAIQSIPDSLTESARLDGASYLKVLIKIITPLCKATIAVITLYYAVGHWNSWFSASIYLRDNTKFPLQLVARNILKATIMSEDASGGDMAQFAELVKYALIVVSTAPILAVYPFLQKYFTKGVMVGAIKG